MEIRKTGEAMETTDPKSNEGTETDSGQGESPCAHRGTRSRRRKELKALADERRVLEISPEAKMLEDLATERKEFQELADKMGWTKDERELAFTRMHLNQGMNYAKHICDRMGMSPDERAKLREDLQRNVALALGNPDEVPALLERQCRKE